MNRSVTNLSNESRHFRMPNLNPFPRLEPLASRVLVGGTLAAGSLPEMVSDLIDESAVYAVENVKRERFGRRELRS
ncbi:MAG: hypothetical protein WCH84_03065 [Verrucomicrobiota bacterium]